MERYAGKTKNDPRNHTKQHEKKLLVRVISCAFVDRPAASWEWEPFFSSLLGIKDHDSAELFTHQVIHGSGREQPADQLMQAGKVDGLG